MSADHLRSAISMAKWRRSTTYVHVHEYIIAQEQPDAFKVISEAIATSRFRERYKNALYRVLFIDGMKYWRMGNIINRKPGVQPKSSLEIPVVDECVGERTNRGADKSLDAFEKLDDLEKW
jgi:hypothetical protein